jgi:hypothetical protein
MLDLGEELQHVVVVEREIKGEQTVQGNAQ